MLQISETIIADVEGDEVKRLWQFMLADPVVRL
jgi:hypothetical protein